MDQGMVVVLWNQSSKYCRHHLELGLSLIKNAIHPAEIDLFEFLTYSFCVLVHCLEPTVLLCH